METTDCVGAEVSLLKEEKVLSWQDEYTGQLQAVLEVPLKSGRTGQAGWRRSGTASLHSTGQRQMQSQVCSPLTRVM